MNNLRRLPPKTPKNSSILHSGRLPSLYSEAVAGEVITADKDPNQSVDLARAKVAQVFGQTPQIKK